MTKGVAPCHRIEFGECSQFDDLAAISVSNFNGKVVQVFCARIDLFDWDAVDHDAEFGLTYFESWECL